MRIHKGPHCRLAEGLFRAFGSSVKGFVSMPVYLKVSFRDKDIVKALGARWDGAERKWFVPEYQDASKFARWMDDASGSSNGIGARPQGEGQTTEAFAPTNEAGEKTGASLASVMFEVSEAVRKNQPRARWIRAEVAAAKGSASGHFYLDLVEHDQTGREVAKASGRIWSSSTRILKRFEKETGAPLAAGMKILFLGLPDFSIQYGFGITVEDLDPSWTLGEMERKTLEIRARLKEEGLYDQNSRLPFPRDFTRVCIVAPDAAAGLGDFMVDADRLSSAGLCDFVVFSALFEGVGAKQSILDALAAAEAEHSKRPFDALAIIRGGGAKTSLNWLNDFDLAKGVARFPTPVMTGIGHERDSGILDEVASRRFDTPSKTIGFVSSVITGNASGAMECLANIRAVSFSMAAAAEQAADARWNDISATVGAVLSEGDSSLGALVSEMGALASGLVTLAESELSSKAKEIFGLGPSGTLSRGYAIVKDGNGVVPSSKTLGSGFLTLVFADGEVDGSLTVEASRERDSGAFFNLENDNE